MVIRRRQERLFFLRVAALKRVVATDATVVAPPLLLPSLAPTTHTGVGVVAIALVVVAAVVAAGMTADSTTITLPRLIIVIG